MFQTIRQAQPSQVVSYMSNGLEAAEQKILEIRGSALAARESPGRAAFLQQIKEIDATISDLKETILTSPLINTSLHKFFINKCGELEKKIHILYSSVLQSANLNNTADIDLLMDLTSELERILVDQTAPKYNSHTQVIPIPTPADIGRLDPSLASNFKSVLQEFRTTFQGHKVTCFASYDWSSSQQFVKIVADDLKLAGVDVVFDVEEGPDSGRDIPKLEEKLLETNHVIVFGTRIYGDKTRSDVKSGVKDEALLIVQRFSNRREDVILFLLEGRPLYSFPPLMNTDRIGYLDCRRPSSYFPSVIRALERLYYHIAKDNQQLLNFIAEKKSLFP